MTMATPTTPTRSVTTSVTSSATSSNNTTTTIVCNNPACDEKDPTKQQQPRCELAGKCVEACSAYGKVCPCISRAAGRAACQAVTKLREDSRLFTSAEPHFRKLNPDDLVIGEKLGEGGFSVVHACTLQSDPDKKLAIKYLKRQVMVNKRQFEHGASDLAQEAHFLSELNHPNIIQLHGVTAGSVQTNVASGKECGFFITVDRLYDTLEKRLERWREDQEKHHSSGKQLLSRMGVTTGEFKERKRQELRERVQVALHIADAMCYLHDRNIIFRDLKPDNIGWDSHGELKLYDFGLAKELKNGLANEDGTYQLTGNTGSRRYMAPEVAKEMPYNKSVDAYSFGILLHEILTAEKPFQGYSAGKHMSLVIIGGERPKMDSGRTAFWPMNLQWLMKRCWSPFPEKRPDFHSIRQTLVDVLENRDSCGMICSGSTSNPSSSDVTTIRPQGIGISTTPSSLPTSGIGALLRVNKRATSKGKAPDSNCSSPVKAQGPNAAKRTGPWGRLWKS